MSTDLKETFLKRIEETNELFNNSTKAQKRVMIAQDCIDRIKSNLLEARKGIFISRLSNMRVINKETLNDNLCYVCAKGGLFASYVGRANNFKTECGIRNDENNSAHKKLLQIFSLKQLAIIEFAFEREQYIWSVDIDNENKLEEFYDSYNDSNERFIAICENIIENKGTFKV